MSIPLQADWKIGEKKGPCAEPAVFVEKETRKIQM
jgi:hypothetical protein